MTDSRPQPQYGEYATPEQQAAAMGKAYVPPPDPATRVAVAPPGVAEVPAAAPFRLAGNVVDRFFTVFQLGIALVLLASTDYFHVGQNANTLFEEVGLTQRVSLAIDAYGWLLLATNIVLLLGTFVWAFVNLRRGRLAFYIPIVGYLAFSSLLAIALASAVLR